MRTVKYITLGCKVNQYETQSIRERFASCNFQEVQGKGQPDLCLINTCTVTSVADHKSKDAIRRSIRANPGAKIVVTGCLVKKDINALKFIKGVDYIIPKSFFPDGTTSFSGHTRAFLKIQDGCSNFCSYCKVPLVRGKSRSRNLTDIIKEAECLAASGYKEIVLTGICIGAYGKDLKPKKRLIDVIAGLENIKGLERIRISSIEAGDVTDELIEVIAESKKLCPHLHIPIQSGDDVILKKMNRRYTNAGYFKLIERIKREVPGIAITTDCLVGFPGETQEQFLNTARLVEMIMPLKTHIFPYSLREGTKASKLKSVIPAQTLKKRVEYLKSIADNCAKRYRFRFREKEVEVLFETRTKGGPGEWEGYSENYIKVLVKDNRNIKNMVKRCKLKRFSGEVAFGEISEM